MHPDYRTNALSRSRARPDPDFIIYGFSEALLTTQVFLRRLHRNMPQQELNLFQFASGSMAKASAGPPKIVWGEFRNSKSLRVLLHNVPDHLLGHVVAPDSPDPAYATK